MSPERVDKPAEDTAAAGETLLVKEISVPQQRTFDEQPFPLLLACRDRAADRQAIACWIAAQRERLESLLARHGAILFRDFPIASAEDFDAFLASFGYENFPYDQSFSNAVRVNRTERVFSANEAPPDVTIFFHHEMAQTPIFPSKLFFFCEKPADRGGATPLCRSDVLFERLAEVCPDFARACQEKGLRYSNVMPDRNDPTSGMGRSWHDTFRAADRPQAERRMEELGYTWQWLPDGSVRATTPVLPAVREVAPGRKVFFNQLIAAFQGWKDSRNDPTRAITFGDGRQLDREAVARAVELAEELAFDVVWQRGDVAWVDNYLVMHARRQFKGTRTVLASLVAPQSHTAVPGRAQS